jgi:NAD(P)-dependent dehydrogenase (short-subunit alcohol dehydrogenase family)
VAEERNGGGRLAGKNAVVTGGASGLGRAVVLAFAAEGANVIAVDRDEKLGARVIAEAAERGGGAAVLHVGDVTEEATIIGAVERSVSEFGSLDVMHNNAGWQAETPIHETSNEQWQRMVATNLTAVFWGCKHAVIAMRKQQRGSIINTASTLAITADAMVPGYCATKAGVVGLTRAVALAYIGEGIRCNAICPGDMDTPLTQGYFNSTSDPAGARREVEEASPIKRLADPAEIATAIVYLASDEASFANGAAFVVDGGLTIKTY